MLIGNLNSKKQLILKLILKPNLILEKLDTNGATRLFQMFIKMLVNQLIKVWIGYNVVVDMTTLMLEEILHQPLHTTWTIPALTVNALKLSMIMRWLVETMHSFTKTESHVMVEIIKESISQQEMVLLKPVYILHLTRTTVTITTEHQTLYFKLTVALPGHTLWRQEFKTSIEQTCTLINKFFSISTKLLMREIKLR